MKKLNEEQINEFNDRWENIIFELTDESKKIEKEMLEQHEAERARLEEEIMKIQAPGTKYSPHLLNDKFRLQHLVKGKRYAAAKVIKETIERKEEEEDEEWQRRFYTQLEKRKELLYKKQRNEYEALKTRLEKSINAKLKQRMNEYEKLLQRIQNLQNELIIKQSLQFSKIQATNAKLLAKYSLNLGELEEKFIDAQNIDFSNERRISKRQSTNSNGNNQYVQNGYGQPYSQFSEHNPGANFSQHFQSSAHHNMRTVDEREDEEQSSEFRPHSRAQQLSNAANQSNGRNVGTNEWKENIPLPGHGLEAYDFSSENNVINRSNNSPNGNKTVQVQRENQKSTPLAPQSNQQNISAPLSNKNSNSNKKKQAEGKKITDESYEEESLDYGDDDSESEEESTPRDVVNKKPSLLATLEARRNLMKAQNQV